MLIFAGTVVTAAMMTVVVISVMDISRAAKIMLASLIGIWIGPPAAVADAGGFAISRPAPDSRRVRAAVASFLPS